MSSPTKSPLKKKQRPDAEEEADAAPTPRSPLFNLFDVSLCGLACKECSKRNAVKRVTLYDTQTIMAHANKHHPHILGRPGKASDVELFQEQAHRMIAKKLTTDGLQNGIEAYINHDVRLIKTALCACGKDLIYGTGWDKHRNQPGHCLVRNVYRVTTILGRTMTRTDLVARGQQVLQTVAGYDNRLVGTRPQPRVLVPSSRANIAPNASVASIPRQVVYPFGWAIPPVLQPVQQLFITPGHFVAPPAPAPARTGLLEAGTSSSKPASQRTSRTRDITEVDDDLVLAVLEECHRGLSTDDELEDWDRLMDTRALTDFIKTIVTETENEKVYVSFMRGWYNSLDHRKTTPEEQLLWLVDEVNRDVDPEAEPLLAKLIDAVPDWISRIEYAAQTVPADIRAEINEWTIDARQGAPTAAHQHPYTCRHLPSSFKKPLEQFLKFACRVQRTSKLFKSDLDKAEQGLLNRGVDAPPPKCVEGFINPLIVACVLEGGTGAESVIFQPTILQYLLATSCRIVVVKSRDEECQRVAKLRTIDQIATIFAACLSFMKAAPLIALVLQAVLVKNGTKIDPRVLINRARHGVPMNRVAPFIKSFRIVASMKTKAPPSRTHPDGGITVHDHEFPYKVWSQLIPRGMDKFIALLSFYFPKGCNWTSFLDLAFRVHARFDRTRKKFVVTARGMEDVVLNLEDVAVETPDHSDLLIARMTSYARFFFDMLGVGAARAKEVNRLTKANLRWSDRTIHYNVEVHKSGNWTFCGSRRDVPHELPSRVARAVLLYFHVVEQVKGYDLLCFPDEDLKPELREASHFCRALEEIFELPVKLSALDARQFCSAMSNYLTGGIMNALTADPMFAKMFGHTDRTHRENYASFIANYEAQRAAFWHKSLGYRESIHDDEVSHEDLIRALKHRFGKEGAYRSVEQANLVASSARKDFHVMANLACGGGKSQAWELVAIASQLADKSVKSMLIVAPFKFLACTLLHAYNESFEQAFPGAQSNAVCWLPSDVVGTDPPPELMMPGQLPKVIFTTPDWLEVIDKFDPHPFEAQRDYIHRIHIDEGHMFTDQLTFRACFHGLPKLASYGIPITVASATLPATMQGSICRFLNLTKALDIGADMEVIGDCQPTAGGFSEGFQIKVERSATYIGRAASAALFQLSQAAQRGDKECVHVICSTKDECKAVAQRLTDKKVVAIVTGDTLSDDQRRISCEWRDGKLDVLVTTTTGLVGNECPSCHTVIVCGCIYSLSNMGQALGRLRESQRVHGGLFLFVFPPGPPPPDLVSKDQSRLRELQRVGIIDESATAAAEFNAVCTVMGLYKWVDEPGCRLVRLHRAFGTTRGDCLVCDRCRTNTVRVAAKETQRRLAQEAKMQSAVARVIKHLEQECICRGRSDCNGDKCVRGCFVCGRSGHTRDTCPLKVAFEKKQHLVCTWCLDYKRRPGFKEHHCKYCPLQRRLRRVFITEFHKEHPLKKVPEGTSEAAFYVQDFKKFLDDKLASLVTWSEFVVNAVKPLP